MGDLKGTIVALDRLYGYISKVNKIEDQEVETPEEDGGV